MSTRRQGVGFVLGAILGIAMAAAGLPGEAVRAEAPILTVGGLAGGAKDLTLDDLRQMGVTELTTSTPWTEGVSRYSGVSGRRFVEALKASGAEVVAEAINDYRVVIPFEVLNSDEVLVAFARDGQPMSIRDKGPLWILFPFDADPDFLSDTYRTYSIWNLSYLEFR